MNFGIIGYGNIAKRFAESIQFTNGGQVTAIGSKSLAKNEAFKATHPAIHVYETYEALLSDPTIEGVYIALPHGMHKEWALKALAAKIPVLCEKPAVLTTKDMQEIIDLATEQQTLFVEAFKTKYNTGFNQVKAALEDLGEIQRVEASFCFDVTDNRDPNSYLFQEGQGGALNDVGTYSIGFVLGIVDSPITRIEGQRTFFNQIDEYFSVTICFENGVEAFVEGGIDREKERVARIIGEHGEITIPFFYRLDSYDIHLHGQEKMTQSYPIVGDDMTLEIQHFIDLVTAQKNECPIHRFADMKKIIEVMEQIRQS